MGDGVDVFQPKGLVVGLRSHGRRRVQARWRAAFYLKTPSTAGRLRDTQEPRAALLSVFNATQPAYCAESARSRSQPPVQAPWAHGPAPSNPPRCPVPART